MSTLGLIVIAMSLPIFQVLPEYRPLVLQVEAAPLTSRTFISDDVSLDFPLTGGFVLVHYVKGQKRFIGEEYLILDGTKDKILVQLIFAAGESNARQLGAKESAQYIVQHQLGSTARQFQRLARRCRGVK